MFQACIATSSSSVARTTSVPPSHSSASPVRRSTSSMARLGSRRALTTELIVFSASLSCCARTRSVTSTSENTRPPTSPSSFLVAVRCQSQ